MIDVRASSYAFRALMLSAALGVVACTDSMSMQMPTGYTYHDQVYKAPPGPEANVKEAKIIHVDTSRMNNMMTETVTMGSALPPGFDPNDPAIAAQLRLTADELIARLLRNLGRPMEPTYVLDSSPLTAALKDSMARNQLPIAANPGDGPFVIDHSISGTSATMTFYSNHDPVRTDEAPAVDDAPGSSHSAEMPVDTTPADTTPVEAAPDPVPVDSAPVDTMPAPAQ